ncbi:hypothetical protein ACFLYA_02585 [Candidatus Dependentiae bacterium]
MQKLRIAALLASSLLVYTNILPMKGLITTMPKGFYNPIAVKKLPISERTLLRDCIGETRYQKRRPLRKDPILGWVIKGSFPKKTEPKDKLEHNQKK